VATVTDPLEVTATGAESITTTSEGPLGPIEWKRPFQDVDSVPTLAAARMHIGFDIVPPGKLGPPAAIYVTDEDAVPEDPVSPEQRLLVLVYDHPELGVFYVTETKVDGPTDMRARFEAWKTDMCPDPEACPAPISFVKLVNGTDGILVVPNPGPDAPTSFIHFVPSGSEVLVDIVGPHDSFTGEEAVAAARAFLAGYER
jgi:hypothetical protein